MKEEKTTAKDIAEEIFNAQVEAYKILNETIKEIISRRSDLSGFSLMTSAILTMFHNLVSQVASNPEEAFAVFNGHCQAIKELIKRKIQEDDNDK